DSAVMGVQFSKAKAKDGSKSPRLTDVNWTQVLRHPNRTLKDNASERQDGAVIASMTPVNGTTANPTRLESPGEQGGLYSESNGINGYSQKKMASSKVRKDVVGALAQAFYLPEKPKRKEKSMAIPVDTSIEESELPP